MNLNIKNVQKQPPRGVLRKRCSEICSKFTGEHPCRSVISIKLQSNFTEITLRHGCSPLNLLHVFWTPFPRNTSGWLLLNVQITRINLKVSGIKWDERCRRSCLQLLTPKNIAKGQTYYTSKDRNIIKYYFIWCNGNTNLEVTFNGVLHAVGNINKSQLSLFTYLQGFSGNFIYFFSFTIDWKNTC